ncbi:unnamed protein product [Penicillium viridicatum]
MPLLRRFSQVITPLQSLRSILHESAQRETYPNAGIAHRLWDVVSQTWDLGFTAFGGPPVHFQIYHARFVEGQGGKEKWIDEETYQELFAISQSLPGPTSTKMLFCLALLRGGLIPAIVVFTLWCLPGAIGMFALAQGVRHMSETLPGPVYALLSGFNASVVGVFALSGVALAHRTISDKLSRLMVLLGACAGLCYSAVWYFPVLIVVGGATTVIWDGWMSRRIRLLRSRWKNRKLRTEEIEEANDGMGSGQVLPLKGSPAPRDENIRLRNVSRSTAAQIDEAMASREEEESQEVQDGIRPLARGRINSWTGASFIGILVSRSQLPHPPRLLDLFANMYLAGTILFGGGPVVMPLLRSYVVDPGWVSSRDFLIGLAIIQVFPGPNLNFAVFLGALSMQQTGVPSILGGVLGGFAIFFPGIILVIGVQGFWDILRKKWAFASLLRGVNATAVGFMYTAVYRLWKAGYLTAGNNNGQSLETDPWWAVIAAVTYTGCAWFEVPPAIGIIIGGILGLCRFGVIGRN